MFIDDTTLSEVIDLTHHLSGNPIGSTQRNGNIVLQFTNDERMQLNGEKCKKMVVIDVREIKTEIARVKIGDNQISRVKSYKLLGLHLLNILRSYGASTSDLLVLYCRVIRSVLEYGAQIWSGGLPQMQNNSKTCPENNLSRPW